MTKICEMGGNNEQQETNLQLVSKTLIMGCCGRFARFFVNSVEPRTKNRL